MLKVSLTTMGEEKMKMNALDYIVWILVAIGGLNWGLVGAFDFNLVDSLFGVGSMPAKIVYVLVGVAAIYSILSVLVKSIKGSSKA